MKNIKKLALILCLPLILTGCGTPTLSDGKQVVAEIDGKQFSVEELFDAMKDDYGTGVLVNIVNDHITNNMLSEDELKQAEENAKNELESYRASYGTDWNGFLTNYGFSSEQDFLNTLTVNQKQQLTIEKYIASDVITEEEITTYYEENIFGAVTARHILVEATVADDMTGTEQETAKANALTEANAIIAELQNSTNLEEDFSNKAKEVSDDPGSKETGGLYENFTNESGFVDEFWEASLNLATGTMTTTPVETEFGYHIIYKVSQQEKPTLDSVRDKIITDLTEELLADQDAYLVYWAGLREKNNFKIHDNTIKETYDFSMDNLN